MRWLDSKFKPKSKYGFLKMAGMFALLYPLGFWIHESSSFGGARDFAIVLAITSFILTPLCLVIFAIRVIRKEAVSFRDVCGPIWKWCRSKNFWLHIAAIATLRMFISTQYRWARDYHPIFDDDLWSTSLLGKDSVPHYLFIGFCLIMNAIRKSER